MANVKTIQRTWEKEEFSMSKVAVLSIDVEEWYQLEYFQNSQCDKSQEVSTALHARANHRLSLWYT